MMPRNRLFRNLLGMGVLSLAMSSCATASPGFSYTPRPFTVSNFEKLRSGLPGDSLITMFGAPDTTYALSFGKKTDSPWEGIAWRYLVEPDTTFVFIERPAVNTFYLYSSNQGLLLHHWVLERETAGRLQQ